MRIFFITALTVLAQVIVLAQAPLPSRSFGLREAVEYALQNQPAIQQAEVDEEITAANIRSRLADWYPQVNFSYNYQHNFVLPTTIIEGTPRKFGVDNTSSAQFTVSQPIFNRDVLLASRTKRDVMLQARQSSESERIETAAAVSKAFYNVLASEQQVRVSEENIIRIRRSLQDAQHQYEAGIADKTDYKRATIGLNNALASKKNTEESLKANTAYLKSLMGFPADSSVDIVYDSLAMEKEVELDSSVKPDMTRRIEYRMLQTRQELLRANLKYEKWSFLPSLSANGAYNFNYQNDALSKLYGMNFPNSFAALTLSIPILAGGRRKADIEAAQWQLQRNRLEIKSFENAMNAEYEAALSAYKGNLAQYLAMKDNLALAREVYDIIRLQYRSGIKTYLEVINSETDLRTAQVNYYNSLYYVLASRIDVQRALGQINY